MLPIAGHADTLRQYRRDPPAIVDRQYSILDRKFHIIVDAKSNNGITFDDCCCVYYIARPTITIVTTTKGR